MDEQSADLPQQRLRDAARFVRSIAYGRHVRPTADLLALADWLEAAVGDDPVTPRCKRCRKPLPPYTGRGAPRKFCEDHRKPRPGQYRANIAPTGRMEP